MTPNISFVVLSLYKNPLNSHAQLKKYVCTYKLNSQGDAMIIRQFKEDISKPITVKQFKLFKIFIFSYVMTSTYLENTG